MHTHRADRQPSPPALPSPCQTSSPNSTVTMGSAQSKAKNDGPAASSTAAPTRASTATTPKPSATPNKGGAWLWPAITNQGNDCGACILLGRGTFCHHHASLWQAHFGSQPRHEPEPIFSVADRHVQATEAMANRERLWQDVWAEEELGVPRKPEPAAGPKWLIIDQGKSSMILRVEEAATASLCALGTEDVSLIMVQGGLGTGSPA